MRWLRTQDGDLLNLDHFARIRVRHDSAIRPDFTAQIPGRRESWALVASSGGAEVTIARGIETQEEAEILRYDIWRQIPEASRIAMEFPDRVETFVPYDGQVPA